MSSSKVKHLERSGGGSALCGLPLSVAHASSSSLGRILKSVLQVTSPPAHPHGAAAHVWLVVVHQFSRTHPGSVWPGFSFPLGCWDLSIPTRSPSGCW